MAYAMMTGSGTHRKGRAKHRKTDEDGRERGDVTMRPWVVAVGVLPFTLIALSRVPYGALWISLILASFVMAMVVRLMRQPGDRRFLIREDVVETNERAVNAAKLAKDVGFSLAPAPMSGVSLVQAVPVGRIHVTPPVVGERVYRTLVYLLGEQKADWLRKNKAMVIFLMSMLLLTLVKDHNAKALTQARLIEADTDRLLGTPGIWNNYQPIARRE